MGIWAEFEEKEFETLANAAFVMHLVSGSSGVRLFSPGQVLEKTLGFDFGTRIDRRTVLYRQLFGRFPGAAGISSAQAQAHQIPVAASTRLLNLFLQYKRPEHFGNGHRSNLWPRDQTWLRFTVSENAAGGGHHFTQVAAMDALQSSLGASALVRYCCPSVWQKNELYGRFHQGTLLESSVFVQPHLLRAPSLPGGFHRRWTFQATNLRYGRGNPAGSFESVETGEDLFLQARQRAPLGPTSELYGEYLQENALRLQGVESFVRAREEKRPRRERARSQIEDAEAFIDLGHFSPAERQPVQRSLAISHVARDLGLEWIVVAVDA